MEKVSVIVPCYNELAYIDECLDSILSQKNVDLEVLVVDDWSTDGTFARVEERRQQDKRIRLHRNPQNIGSPSAGRNLGIQLATGDYVAMVDADDMLLEDAFLARMAQELRSNQADIGYCGFLSENPDLQYKPWVSVWHKHPRTATNIADMNQYFWYTTPHMAAFKMYNREFLLNHNLSFPDIRIEDQPFSLLTFFLARKICLEPSIAYYYRQLKTNGIHRYDRYDFQNYAGNLTTMQWLLQELQTRGISVVTYQEQLAIIMYRLFNPCDIREEINLLFAYKCKATITQRQNLYNEMRTLILNLWSQFESLEYKFFAPEEKEDVQDLLNLDFVEYAITKAGKNDIIYRKTFENISRRNDALGYLFIRIKNIILEPYLAAKMQTYPKLIRYPLTILLLIIKFPRALRKPSQSIKKDARVETVPMKLLKKIQYYRKGSPLF